MAPSQMEHQQEQSLGQGYTHKKFNCGYSHKKLGMRLRQREGVNNKENQETSNCQQTQEITKKSSASSSSSSSRGLFRPYALGDDTPRKRKVSRDSDSSSSSSSSDEECSSQQEPQQQQYIASPQTSPVAAYYQQQYQQHQSASPVSPAPSTCASPALSPNSYAQRLQRQRAALYMRYMQQFHSGSQNLNSTEAAATYTSAPATSISQVAYHPMGYPNVTAPIFNGC